MAIRTYEQINAKIRSGQAVVMTADEVLALVAEKGVSAAAQEVDVVTTGTFGPMCSSSAYFSFGHTKPRMKMQKVWMNGIPAYTGLAAVDALLGATELPENDPCNTKYPGEFRYGGAHVLQELVEGKRVRLEAEAYGTDCYPRKSLDTTITLAEINEAVLFNPRNCYQNYNCAVNLSSRTIYTYMGQLKPNLGNAHYCSAGQLSPLLKDPDFRTIGIGTRIFLGGAQGFVSWNGTQHSPGMQTDSTGASQGAAGGTLAVMGNLKEMDARYLRGTSFQGYGVSLAVGIGIPIPILDEEILRNAALSDADLYAPIVDYSDAYPNRIPGNLGRVSYAQLKSGSITVEGKEVPTAPLSSYLRAKEIAEKLRDWIRSGEFLLSEPAQLLPASGISLNALEERPLGKEE